ncbi:MAG: hypothetical protein JWL59_3735 [Chthoniobacteraceae bacterium]|nr:hypothetical protein [Chthoniobacteraceae bacterium]
MAQNGDREQTRSFTICNDISAPAVLFCTLPRKRHPAMSTTLRLLAIATGASSGIGYMADTQLLLDAAGVIEAGNGGNAFISAAKSSCIWSREWDGLSHPG